MDRVDRHILSELQADARLSINELARRVSLSAPSTGERVRKLQDMGVITGYHAHINPELVGREVRALVRMQCYGPTCILKDKSVRQWPELRWLVRVTGDDCSVMQVELPHMLALEELLDRLSAYGRPTSSLIVDEPLAWSPTQPADASSAARTDAELRP